MGKAKPVKKSGSPLKISTSLFHRRSKPPSGGGGPGSEESSLSSPSPPPKKVAKTKPTAKDGKKSASSSSTSPAKKIVKKVVEMKKKAAAATESSTSTKKKVTAAVKVKASSSGSSEKAKVGSSSSSSSPVKAASATAVKGKFVKAAKKGSPGSASGKSKDKTPSKANTSGSSVKKGASPSKKTLPRKVVKKRTPVDSTTTDTSSVTSVSSYSSSSTSRNTRTTSSEESSRTPSPAQKPAATPRKKAATSSNSKATPKKGTPAKSTSSSSKNVTTNKKSKSLVEDLKTKVLAKKMNKAKSTIIAKKSKSVLNKAKGKRPVKPKAKLRRMASLNAKAILEATLSFEAADKKKSGSPAGTPTKTSIKGSTSDLTSAGAGSSSATVPVNDAIDLKPLTLLFSQPQTTEPIISTTSAQKTGERKRKSSTTAAASKKDTGSSTSTVANRRESTGNNAGASTSTRKNNVSSESSHKESGKPKKGGTGSSASASISTSTSTAANIKSPKKVKVSSVSTSTSPFEMGRDDTAHQQSRGQSFVPYVAPGSSSVYAAQGQSVQHRHSNTSSSSSGKQSKGVNSAGCQTQRDRNQSVTPVGHYGSTVYQPAGPLIEPHKMVSTVMPVVQSGLLPESVRLPADLKVTYQTHPPTTSVLTSSSASSSNTRASNSSSTKHSESRQQRGTSSSSGVGTSSAGCQTAKHSSKQVLHQPYKSAASSSSSNSNSFSSSSSSTVTRPITESVNISSFVAPQGSFALPGSSPSLLAQQAAGLSGNSSQGTSIYYGYGGAPHQSPFAPSKFPIVPPDSFRTPSPYPSSFLYTPSPATPQPNYLMTPFYTPPLTPNTASAGLNLGGIGQPRALLAAHHPSTQTGSATYFHTGPPPSAHPTASNYYLAASPLQPSIPSAAAAPGHAGPSHPNRSSHPACPTDCSPQNNNSTSSSSSSFISNNRASKQQPQLRRQQQRPTSATPREVGRVQGTRANPNPGPVLTATTKTNRRKDSPTPAVAALPPKTFRLQNNSTVTKLDSLQARQLESAKTFTEQYSLPDDITITPIIMNPNDTKSMAFNSSFNARPERKRKDVVHLIDPKSGQKTTIAKHISNKNIVVNHANQQNVSSVKPNNAGKVGKISPDLDVIVLGGGAGAGKRSSYNANQQPQNLSVNRNPRFGHATATANNRSFTYGDRSRGGNSSTFVTNSNTNMVLPLPQVVARSENKATTGAGTGTKRKGLSLSECIDGLQRKKMRILADTNISITNVTPSNNPFLAGYFNQDEVTISPANIGVDSSIYHHQQQQKSGRKDNNPKQRANTLTVNSRKGQGQGQIVNRKPSCDSEIGSTIIDCNDAMVAASALVIPQVGLPYTVSNFNMGIGIRKKPLKIKISKTGGKITTRSSVQNTKVKTRAQGRQVTPKVSPASSADGRNRLIRLTKTKDGHQSEHDFVVEAAAPTGTGNYPTYFTMLNRVRGKAGNGSSTTTQNNHVILRIPKNSSGKTTKSLLKVDTASIGRWPNVRQQQHFPASTSTASGNMTLAAMKKRAIVKPLSPTIINGAISALPSANRKPLPTHPHPRWSNGWTFEGKSFEAKVYIRNDDQPVFRRCYSLMRHDGGDVIRPRDCVLLKSGPRKTDLPFVAKVASLWENPTDGEMMFSLLWYYRPEHTEMGRLEEDMPDEIFASKHRDSNSVATIEDKCYVLTFNEYCRYKKRLKQLRDGVPPSMAMVPLCTNPSSTNTAVTNFASDIATAVWSGIVTTVPATGDADAAPAPADPLPLPPPALPPVVYVPTPGKVSPEVVFFCRKVYDYRQKRMLKNPT